MPVSESETTATEIQQENSDGRDDAQRSALAAYQSTCYRYFVLGILTLIYAFNFIDRQVVNILGQAIIDDLGLSDAQFGALSGIAFAAIYVIMGIPLDDVNGCKRDT